MDIALIALQTLLATVFLIAGGTKLMGQRMHVQHFAMWGYPQWFRVVTGAVEVTGAAGLIVGIWAPGVAVAAALWLVATTIGAVYTDLFRSTERVNAIAPLVLLVLAASVGVLRLGDAWTIGTGLSGLGFAWPWEIIYGGVFLLAVSLGILLLARGISALRGRSTAAAV